MCRLARRQGLFAAAPLIPRLPLGTAVAGTLRRPSPPLSLRLVEPWGSNPASSLSQ
jgi:hypothetical protein